MYRFGRFSLSRSVQMSSSLDNTVHQVTVAHNWKTGLRYDSSVRKKTSQTVQCLYEVMNTNLITIYKALMLPNCTAIIL